jgi:endoglucanase
LRGGHKYDKLPPVKSAPSHPFHSNIARALLLTGAIHLFCAVEAQAVAPNAYVRLNQAGYITGETKQAVLLADGAESGTFSVVNATNSTVVFTNAIPATSLGKWSTTFPDTYTLDFSAVTNPGVYRIQVTATISATSSNFPINLASVIYTPLLTNTLFFFQSQRDGPNVLTNILNRKPCHLLDTNALTYLPATYSNDSLVGGLTNSGGANIDASGGWFDAGDYPKFVETTSYVVPMMFIALRDYPNRLRANGDFLGEAEFGLDWLLKMWDQTNRILYYQVGIGDGNGGTILGDHDYWRLPEADNTNLPASDPGYYAISHRPAFRYGPAGSQISPNLAGRLAAAFALASQVLRQTNSALASQCLVDAQTIFDLAQTNNVTVFSTSPNDYYPETSWHDDMEWGAAELYFATAQTDATGLPHTNALFYLQAAAYWASNYIASDSGSDTLNLYDTSAMGHYETCRAIAQAGNPAGLAITQTGLLNDLVAQLSSANTQSGKDPFGFAQAYPSLSDPTPHALGLAITANLYKQLTGLTNYDACGRAQRDWVLGRNAWGTTFIVGDGWTFPHCMQDQIGNLGCNLDGVPPIRLGATVDGPTDSTSGNGTPSGANTCNDTSSFSTFNAAKGEYLDGVAYWMTVEPAQDYTVPTILLFAQQMGELTGAPAPVLQSPVFAGSNFGFNLTGSTGNSFIIQASTNFVNWNSLQTNTAPFNFTDTSAGSYTARFYRAVSPP